ncbi:MAG TPA: ABC transporter substrate-binding protein [Candidatus Limnocylindrales bacterium]|nr:ABC transporter substrate-binding protein [Candidatus Limnocylindrales bacterium]
MENVRIRVGRSFSIGLSVLLVCAGFDNLAHAQLQKVRITISSRSNTSVPYYVAVSKGFFRDEGLDAEVIQANPRLGVMALMNGDVYFTGTFVSTVRGILSGFPLKIILVSVKRGVYYLIAHSSVKDLNDLKGKRLGVSSIRGSDHLVAEELFRSKGFNPAQLQPVALGDTSVRLQSVLTGAVEVTALSPPHDLMAQNAGLKALAGPPELGMPASGMLTSDRIIKDNPQLVRRGVRAILKANRFIAENRSETIKVLLQWVKQTPEIAARSYDVEIKAIQRDGTMSDADMENFIERLGNEKKRSLDEVRDFSFARAAWKELESSAR